jgi:hypothetical protein
VNKIKDASTKAQSALQSANADLLKIQSVANEVIAAEQALGGQQMTDQMRQQMVENSSIYKTGVEAIELVSSQGLDSLDNKWQKSMTNHKTVLFSVMSSMSSVVKSTFESMITDQAKLLLSNALIEGSELIKKNSFIESAAAAVSSAASTASAWVGSAAQVVATGATMIAQNLVVAASFAANAIAAAFAAFASIPFVGYLLGIAAAAAVVADWNGIKKTLGFAQGGIAGFGLVGENGPEVVAPMKDFSSMVSDLVSMTQKTMLNNMNALNAGGAGGQTLAALNAISAKMDKTNASIATMHTNITSRVNVSGTMKARGGDMYSAIAHDTTHEQITRA